MAKIRSINPDIWRHKAFLKTSWHCRDVFMYLCTMAADDEGRFDWEPALILENAFPRSYPVNEEDVIADLGILVEAALVIQYGENNNYGFLTGWLEHQYIEKGKRVPSSRPEPPVQINSWDKADEIRRVCCTALGRNIQQVTFRVAVDWFTGQCLSGNQEVVNCLHNVNDPCTTHQMIEHDPCTTRTRPVHDPLAKWQPEVEVEGEVEGEVNNTAGASTPPPEKTDISSDLSTKDKNKQPHIAFAEKLWLEFRQQLPCPTTVLKAAGQFRKSHGQRGADLLLVAFGSVLDGYTIPDGADPETYIAARVREAISRNFEWDPAKQRGQPRNTGAPLPPCTEKIITDEFGQVIMNARAPSTEKIITDEFGQVIPNAG